MVTPDPMHARRYLILAAAITLVAWQFEIGRLILLPFTFLATYAHEMGHGLTALLLGGNFEKLVMNADGSGLAFWTGDIGRLGRGLIALGGLVGPSVAGAIMLVASRKVSRARILLASIAVLMLLTLLLFARSVFAAGFIVFFAAILLVIARFAPQIAPFFTQLIGVQLCLALFRDVSYMFSEGGVIDGVQHRSDSAAVAEALLLPYWFWGGVAAVFSVAVLALGLYVALRPTSTPIRVRR